MASGRPGADVIINVADSGLLERSLALTLQLMETETPMVLALNAFDRKALKTGGQAFRMEAGTAAKLPGSPLPAYICQKGDRPSRAFKRDCRSGDGVPAGRTPGRLLHFGAETMKRDIDI